MKKLLLIVSIFTLTLLSIGLGTTPTYASSTNYQLIDEQMIGRGDTYFMIENIQVQPNTSYSFMWLTDGARPQNITVQGDDTSTLYLDGDDPALYEVELIQQDGDIGHVYNIYAFATGNDTSVTIEGGSFDMDMLYSYEADSNLEFFNLQEASYDEITHMINYNPPVTDTTPPLLSGASVVTLSNVDTPLYTSDILSSLTATDNYDGDLTSSIQIDSDLLTGNEDTLGDYPIEFSVTDSSGNTATLTVTVRVLDVVDPIITLLGNASINLEYGTTWSDPGYTVTDNYDTSVTVNVTGSVDDSTLGTYNLYYNATDSSTNEAVEQVRTVNVVDTTAPVQTLNGDTTVYVEFGDNYTELGASWTDAYDGTGSSIVGGDTVNVGALGTYVVTYNVTDSNGNVATQLTRNVVVRDTTAPTILADDTYTYNTSQFVTAEFIKQSITATDIYDGNLTTAITISNDTLLDQGGTKGTYSITYSVTDSVGNTATKTVTVNVIDNQAPVFSTTANMFTWEYVNTMTQQDYKDYFGVN